MLKYLLSFALASTLLFSQSYPLAYKQLSHPLFKSAQTLSVLLGHEKIKTYNEDINQAILLGFEVDKYHDSAKSKEYLFILRKLQKKYDSLLYMIHKEISFAIDNNDRARFKILTSSKIDGLLQNRTLYKKALKFYKTIKTKKKNAFFEQRIKYTRLAVATNEEFQDEVITSTYDSKKKQTKKKKKVNLEVIENESYLDVYIENLNPYSVSVNVKGTYENLSPNRSNDYVATIKAGERKKYLRLDKIKGAISFGYRFAYTWILGAVNAVHNDTYVYRFPFERGTRVRVSQGFNGTITHNGRSKYAVDFAMNVGTKVYAARGGVVVKIKENSDKGGYDKKFSNQGNYVTIEHDDSTFAMYYHLKKYGAIVKVGDKVSRGALIANSGNTGYSSGPHLHFAVFKASNATRTQTIKIKFLSEKEVVYYVEKGVFYTAK